MPKEFFNDIYEIFKLKQPERAIDEFRVKLAEKNVSEGSYQLILAKDGNDETHLDPVLDALGIRIECNKKSNNGTIDYLRYIASIAARLGLLSRILAMSWHHLSSRKSFGIRTTKHQLVKVEFADISNQIDFLTIQWKLRIEKNDYAEIENDHWQISMLTNRAEKLMGGHGYLLGNTHTLSYLSVMVYSLYGKSSDI